LAFDPSDRWRSAAKMRDAMLEAFATALGERFETIEKRIRAQLVGELASTDNNSGAEKTGLPRRQGRSDNGQLENHFAAGRVWSFPPRHT